MSLGSLAGVGNPFRDLPSLEPERGPSLEPRIPWLVVGCGKSFFFNPK